MKINIYRSTPPDAVSALAICQKRMCTMVSPAAAAAAVTELWKQLSQFSRRQGATGTGSTVLLTPRSFLQEGCVPVQSRHGGGDTLPKRITHGFMSGVQNLVYVYFNFKITHFYTDVDGFWKHLKKPSQRENVHDMFVVGSTMQFIKAIIVCRLFLSYPLSKVDVQLLFHVKEKKQS